MHGSDKNELLGIAEVVMEVDIQLNRILNNNKYSAFYKYKVFDAAAEDTAFIDTVSSEHFDRKHQHFNAQYEIDWFGRKWTIRFESSKLFENSEKDWLSWSTLVLGLVISALGVSFTLVITGFNDQLQREVKLKTKQLATVVHKLQKADKVKNEFLANMSHEIRTPLNAVFGALQVIKQSKQTSKNVELINNAMLSSSSLLSIINDLLDISKLEAGKVTLESVPFDLNKLLSDVIDQQSPLATQKSINLSMRSIAPSQSFYLGDPVRVKQILLNLVSNAIKFTEHGTVAIDCEIYEEKGLSITVSDSGIGIDEKQLSKLFNRFEQADSSTTRRYGGSGLGLAIVEQLIKLMSGSISVTSELNKGSRFTVSLPLIKTTKSSIDEEVLIETPALDLSNKTVLLAEDNKLNQTVFCAMVAKTNVNLIVAENGNQAIVLAHKHKPDFIFMDIQMPELDGEKACIEITKSMPFIPIVALTANVLEADVKRYLSNGFIAHLAKPIVQEKLMQTIKLAMDAAENPKFR